MGRREEILDATIDVLVDRGGRGFTHRAIDRAAGVPMGTTSNFFRTRKDLLLAVAARVAESTTDPGSLDLPTPTTEAELVRVLGRRADTAREEYRKKYLAHAILLFEAISTPEIAEPLLPRAEARRETFTRWLTDLGAADPELGAHLVMMYLRSLLFAEHSTAVTDLDGEAALEPLVWGLLHE